MNNESDLIYSTDSEEHKENLNPTLNQFDELTEWEIKQDIMDSWDTFDRIQEQRK